MLWTNLLPVALAAVHGLNRLLEAFNKMPPTMQKGVISLGVLLALAGPLLSFLGTLLTVGASISTLATSLGAAGISLGAIGSAIGAIGGAVVGVAASVLAILGPILLIVGAVALLYWAFKTNFMGITTAAKQLWFILKYYFAQGWKELKILAEEGLQWLSEAWEQADKIWQTKIQGFIDWLRRTWNSPITYLGQVRNRIIEAFRNVDWAAIGRAIILGIANGMLFGIPGLILIAVKAAQAALAAIKRTMDIRSPSGEMFKLGVQSATGYLPGMQKMMDSAAIAQALVRPVMNSTSSQQVINNISFPYGLSIREVHNMLLKHEDQMFLKLADALGRA